MKSIKFVLTGLITAVFLMPLAAQQQSVQRADSNDSTETSVESEYLSNIEDVVISELAASDGRDNKLVALQYLENAVSEGRTTPDMMRVLDQLAGEGITTESRMNGRLVNNFPDIRARACELLGQVHTEESKKSLIKVALADNEPMVIAAAVRSLGDVGLNDNDDAIETIAWAQKKNAVLNPTSSLALEVLVAYEKLAGTVQNRSSMIQSVGQIATNYNYVAPVRTKALELLRTLQSGSSSSSSNGKATNADAK